MPAALPTTTLTVDLGQIDVPAHYPRRVSFSAFDEAETWLWHREWPVDADGQLEVRVPVADCVIEVYSGQVRLAHDELWIRGPRQWRSHAGRHVFSIAPPGAHPNPDEDLRKVWLQPGMVIHHPKGRWTVPEVADVQRIAVGGPHWIADPQGAYVRPGFAAQFFAPGRSRHPYVVRYDDGRPIPHAMLRHRDGRHPRGQAWTDDQGRGFLDELEPEPDRTPSYQVLLPESDEAWNPVPAATVRRNGDGFVFELPSATIEVRGLPSGSVGLSSDRDPGWWIAGRGPHRVERRLRHRRSSSHVSGGAVVLRFVHAGTWTMRTSFWDAPQPIEQTFEVAAGERVSVRPPSRTLGSELTRQK